MQIVNTIRSMETASLVKMNKPVTFSNEKTDHPGQPIFKITVIVPVEAAIQINVKLAFMEMNGRDIGPGYNKQVACMHLCPGQNLRGDKAGIFVSLDAALNHDCRAGFFTLNKMNPQRILGVFKKDIVFMVCIRPKERKGKQTSDENTTQEYYKRDSSH